MYVCVCIYVCIYIYIYIQTHGSVIWFFLKTCARLAHTCIDSQRRACAYKYLHTYTHAHMSVHDVSTSYITSVHHTRTHVSTSHTYITSVHHPFVTLNLRTARARIHACTEYTFVNSRAQNTHTHRSVSRTLS